MNQVLLPDAETPPDVKVGTDDCAMLTYSRLSVEEAVAHVADDAAGATVLFSGTTRNTFEGKCCFVDLEGATHIDER